MVAQRLKHLPAMRETQVWSLDQEDPLEKEMVTCSSILAWRIPWREEPDRLQSTGLQRVGHDWVTSLSLFMVTDANCIYCSDHFTVYTNIKSLCSTPEANAVFLCQLKKKHLIFTGIFECCGLGGLELSLLFSPKIGGMPKYISE